MAADVKTRIKANGKAGKQIEFDGEWLATVICFALWWPLGALMLFRQFKKLRKRGAQAGQLAGVGGTLIGIGALMLFTGFTRGISWLAIAMFGGGLMCASKLSQRRERKYKKYIAIIGGREIMSIRAIAAAIPTTIDEACRDLQDMINRGYFGDGAYIDNLNKRFVRDASAVNFDEAVVVEVEPEPEEEAKAAPEVKAAPETKAAPANEDEYQKYLRQINEVNERIKDQKISDQIDRIGELTARIFEAAKEKPALAEKTRSFMNYYLPTTLKLLDSYALLERQGIEGENISASKKQIEAIMDTLTKGFEKQLDQLFRAQALDISSDIEVLETMMAKDGLKENKYVMRAGK